MDQEFEDAFASDTPPATGEKSEAELMREQADAEYADGWGMFPDSGDQAAATGAKTAPVRIGGVVATEVKPMDSSSEGEMSFVEAQAKAKAAGRATFNWNGRTFETVGTEREMGRASTTSKPNKPSAPAPATSRTAAPRPVDVLSEDEADALQLASAPAAPPSRPNVNSPSNVWPNNRPATNIYAGAGPTVGASAQTQAARAQLATNLSGKTSVADVMKGARK